MKRETIERTPEEIEQMTRTNRQQYSVVATIIWAVCSVVWTVLLVLDIVHHAAVLQIVLHAMCAVLTATSAVLHFFRWREMKGKTVETNEETHTVLEDHEADE